MAKVFAVKDPLTIYKKDKLYPVEFGNPPGESYSGDDLENSGSGFTPHKTVVFDDGSSL